MAILCIELSPIHFNISGLSLCNIVFGNSIRINLTVVYFNQLQCISVNSYPEAIISMLSLRLSFILLNLHVYSNAQLLNSFSRFSVLNNITVRAENL